MLRPPGFRGAAFGTAADGDGRSDEEARRRISSALGIPSDWAFVRQVHGNSVVEARAAGPAGEADAIVTEVAGLPLTVATADCLPIVLESDEAVAVVHAGWRGLVAGVIAGAVDALAVRGQRVQRAAIGPGIGPCCYEVGPDVVSQFPGFTAVTEWGTPSVDLVAAARAQLGDVPVWTSGRCTMTDPGFNSYRRDKTARRQIGVGWLP